MVTIYVNTDPHEVEREADLSADRQACLPGQGGGSQHLLQGQL